MIRFSVALALLVSMVIVLESGCEPPQSPTPSSRTTHYIDTHSHLDARIVRPDGKSGVDWESAALQAIRHMDELGIEKSLVMPPPQPENFRWNYDYAELAAVTALHPTRFAFLAGGGSLNPMIQEAIRVGAVSQELRSRFTSAAMNILAAGAVGFGELTAEHLSFHEGHPYVSAPPDHELFLLLARIAGERGVPIDLHMESVPRDMETPDRFSSPANPSILEANIAGLSRLLAEDRKAPIVWVHAGWDNTDARGVQLMDDLLDRNPNLYMSIAMHDRNPVSGSPLDANGVLKPEWKSLLVSHSDRFLVGNDDFYRADGSTSPDPSGNDAGIRAILDQLPAEVSRKIAQENAIRLYGLE